MVSSKAIVLQPSAHARQRAAEMMSRSMQCNELPYINTGCNEARNVTLHAVLPQAGKQEDENLCLLHLCPLLLQRWT
jgi:hypothetical protein